MKSLFKAEREINEMKDSAGSAHQSLLRIET